MVTRQAVARQVAARQAVARQAAARQMAASQAAARQMAARQMAASQMPPRPSFGAVAYTLHAGSWVGPIGRGVLDCWPHDQERT